MLFDVNSIISQINKNFPSRPHRYQVQIFGQQNVPDAPAEVMFNCNAFIIPGLNIDTLKEKRYGVGLQYNVVEGKTFAELTLSFYESQYEIERKYFSEWADKMFDPVTKRIGFYKDVVKNILITQYNNNNQIVYQAIVLDCMPSNIGGLERGYGLSETLPQFTVNMQFQDLKETFIQAYPVNTFADFSNLLRII